LLVIDILFIVLTLSCGRNKHPPNTETHGVLASWRENVSRKAAKPQRKVLTLSGIETKKTLASWREVFSRKAAESQRKNNRSSLTREKMKEND
jgi:hypothetical protein